MVSGSPIWYTSCKTNVRILVLLAWKARESSGLPIYIPKTGNVSLGEGFAVKAY